MPAPLAQLGQEIGRRAVGMFAALCLSPLAAAFGLLHFGHSPGGHSLLANEPGDALLVVFRPDAPRPAGGEAQKIARLIQPVQQPVNPSVAQCFFDGLLVGDQSAQMTTLGER